MRPEAVRKALLESEGHPCALHLNDGTRVRVKSREHWLIGEEVLIVRTGPDVHFVAYRNITSIEVRTRKSRTRPA